MTDTSPAYDILRDDCALTSEFSPHCERPSAYVMVLRTWDDKKVSHNALCAECTAYMRGGGARCDILAVYTWTGKKREVDINAGL